MEILRHLKDLAGKKILFSDEVNDRILVFTTTKEVLFIELTILDYDGYNEVQYDYARHADSICYFLTRNPKLINRAKESGVDIDTFMADYNERVRLERERQNDFLKKKQLERDKKEYKRLKELFENEIN